MKDSTARFLIIAGFLLPLRGISYTVMRSRHFVERVLILGTSPLARKLAQGIEARPDAGYAIVGVVDDGAGSEGTFAGYPLYGPLARLAKIIDDVRPGRIIVTMAERRGRLPVDELLQGRVEGILVEDGVDTYERLTGKLAVEALTPSNLIFARDFRKSHFDLAVARAISLVASLIAFIGFAPLFGLIALALGGTDFQFTAQLGRAQLHALQAVSFSILPALDAAAVVFYLQRQLPLLHF